MFGFSREPEVPATVRGRGAFEIPVALMGDEPVQRVRPPAIVQARPEEEQEEVREPEAFEGDEVDQEPPKPIDDCVLEAVDRCEKATAEISKLEVILHDLPAYKVRLDAAGPDDEIPFEMRDVKGGATEMTREHAGMIKATQIRRIAKRIMRLAHEIDDCAEESLRSFSYRQPDQAEGESAGPADEPAETA